MYLFTDNLILQHNEHSRKICVRLELYTTDKGVYNRGLFARACRVESIKKGSGSFILSTLKTIFVFIVVSNFPNRKVRAYGGCLGS